LPLSPNAIVANLAEYFRRHHSLAGRESADREYVRLLKESMREWGCASYALPDDVWKIDNETKFSLTDVPPIPYSRMLIVIPLLTHAQHELMAMMQFQNPAVQARAAHLLTQQKFAIFRIDTVKPCGKPALTTISRFDGIKNTWVMHDDVIERDMAANWIIVNHETGVRREHTIEFNLLCAALTVINDPRAVLTLPPIDRSTARMNRNNRRYKPIPPTHVLTIDKSRPRVVREDYEAPGTGRQRVPHNRRGTWVTRPYDANDCDHTWRIVDAKHKHCSRCSRIQFWRRDAKIHGGGEPQTYVVTRTFYQPPASLHQ
jgi:hypothetical protein